MLFEIRESTPDVSAAWIQARDLFLQGRARAAWKLAAGHRGTVPLRTASDYLLNIEIARACLATGRYKGLVRLAIREFPDDPFVRLYQSRVFMAQSRQTEGIEFLLACERTLGRTHRAWWGTELASMYASAGFESSCLRWLQAVEDEPEFDSPLALYNRSSAWDGLRQWQTAIEVADQCCRRAPNWTRARGHLVHCLLARGKTEAALTQIQDVRSRGHEEAMIDVSAAMLSMSLGRFREARTAFEAFLRDWPQADYEQYIRRTLYILLAELGDYAAAREVAGGDEERLAVPKIEDVSDGRHAFIPLPLYSQSRNQCVPTAVALALHPQGDTHDPDVMFREMHGRDGTALWRMREWCQGHGYAVVPIRLEPAAVQVLLDAGIVPVGSLEGPFNSHVDTICGYNLPLDTLYLRDPGHWAPLAMPTEIALDRYQMSAGLLAVIRSDRQDVIDAVHSWCSDESAALLDLAEAVARGNLSEAEAAWQRIANNSPAAVLRDAHAVNVVISPLEFRDRMQATAQDESAHLAARFRAVMMLGPDDGDGVLARLLEEDTEGRFSVAARRYLRLLQLINDGHWSDALDLIGQLLVRGCSVARFWELKSDILAELGKADASQQALERAIELEPLRLSTREKALSRSASRLTLQAYIDELDALLAQDPDEKGLLFSRANALQEGPDGRAYEAAAREAIKWFPRMPAAYSRMLNWYLVQGRRDLHDRLLAEARRMLPDCFPPEEEQTENSERAGPGENAEAPGSAEMPEPSDGAEVDAQASPEFPLPEDKSELLTLVWQLSDLRRAAALQRAVELQESGHLRWYEVARLTACRLLVPDRPDQEAIAAKELLPENPPGAVAWFADLLCDVLTDYDPAIQTAVAVDGWLLKVLPNLEDYPELWFKHVLLLEHARQFERAVEELLRLVERYPGMASALYRLGVVRYRQQDYTSARKYFEQALEVNPGLVGAMELLRDLHESLGEPEAALIYSRMLRRKLPYSIVCLQREVLSVADLDGPEAATRLLDQAAADFPLHRIAVLRARVSVVAGDVASAEAALSGAEPAQDDDDDAYEDWLSVCLKIAIERDDAEVLLQLCDKGLLRWPDSLQLKELKAESLGRTDRAAASALLREVLLSGDGRDQTARMYLQLTDAGSPDEAAFDVVAAAPEDLRPSLVELFSEVFGLPEFLNFNEQFLVRALREYPESDVVRYRLATHYNMNSRPQLAVKLARELRQRNPDSPEALRMLGRCLVDADPQEALGYLEQACEQDRSVDYLFDLARCLQLAGHPDRARELHWEILGQNPFLSASWTNLFFLDEPKDKLWPMLTPMLEHGSGVEDEYFLVAAVRVALDQRKQLPVCWFPLAVQRWAILQTHPGFMDERTKLYRALVAWSVRRPADVPPDFELPSGLWLQLLARYRWPGLRWIPWG